MNNNGRPLRVLHLTLGSDAGGISRYIFDLCNAMRSEGHEVAVAGDRGAWHWLFEGAPWPWIDIPLKGGPLDFWRSLHIVRQYLSEHPVDLIHAHYRRASLLSRRLQASFHIPILYTVHLSHISMAWPRSLFSDFSDHTHVASELALRWLVDELHVQPDNITLIPHGIDPVRFPLADAAARAAARSALGLADADRVAVYVGRMESPKNEDWMIDLAQASRLQLPNLRVLLVGEGPNEHRLRRRIVHLGLEDRVKMLGHRDPLPIYQAADALLLASLREGFSLVTAEAMSVGVPVLRTNTAGTPELIIENVTGRAVPIDHDAFVSAAIEFLADPAKLARMGQTAARHVREHFTFDRQFAQTMELYHHLVETRAPTR